ncbi:ABC transporter ATP-binding protein [Desulfopila sp. IMCC35006]|uniref:ABC transporter ATP-binding protein n=1 Tax=Desulfopila sp. IMCC35006 TaxID=2569542 RepID=UPI0010ABC18A|nr:ABC transporter ATP-binding protein [Desulfopila sp. IMCC35006]TKB26246.1 ABC transporter ATP-binding protein [Desulfopila sp. IMCC35006]
MALIEVDNVVKIYNPGLADELTAVHAASLSIEAGEVAVLTGPSGSGKTSLLSLIGCMARPTSGRILVDGKDVVKLPERFLTNIRRQAFGFIFQQFHLIRELTVLENVLLPLFPLALGTRTMNERALSILERLKIDNKKHLQVKKLSGGEQQRVAIARALINKPRIIIADEPTAHLDRKLAQEFIDTLDQLNHEGKTIIIATHDPFVHDNPLVTRSIVMRDGQIERIDTK